MKGREEITFKDSRGAVLASEHYTETGHYIKEYGKKTRTRAGFSYEKIYRCSDCDFESHCGTLTNLT